MKLDKLWRRSSTKPSEARPQIAQHLQVRLESPEAVVAREKQERKARRSGRLLLLLSVVVASLLTHYLLPRRVERLNPAEAARILQMQKGFAGYSLIKDGPDAEGSAIGHALFCPSCGGEVATVYVNFLPPAPPQLGSRLAILADLARPAMVLASTPKKVRLGAKSAPVVAAR